MAADQGKVFLSFAVESFGGLGLGGGSPQAIGHNSSGGAFSWRVGTHDQVSVSQLARRGLAN
jgi:hypothetical protein